MFTSTQNRNARQVSAVVDIAPLIDIVFILLIFFLVTTTFVRDTGVRVERPQATTSSAMQPQAMRIAIAAGGAVYTAGQSITLQQLDQRVRRFIAVEPNAAVIVIPDQSVTAGRLIQVMDVARQAGALDVAVATKRPS
ncbi:biopolymer transporter ExbD [Planctomycetales bacterium ZRK34]|nr:biopolymer transporter ExbD [Planctomycetales bacterium ZRK34]